MKGTLPAGLSGKRKRGVQGKIARKRQNDSKFSEALKVNVLRTITGSSDVKSSPLVKFFKNAQKKITQLNLKADDLLKKLTINCVPVTKDAIPKHFPKKDKRKLRHEAFLKKLEVVNEEKKDNKNKRKRAKKNADVNMDEAPTLGMEKESKSSKVEPPEKKKKTPICKSKQPILKKKDRVKQELQDIQLFKEVMSNSVFKANPGAAITNYVRQKVCESLSES